MADTGAQGELEALSAIYAGQTQSSYYNSRAAGSRYEGRRAQTAGNYNQASSLIGGLASGASIYSRNEPSFKRTTPTLGRSSGFSGGMRE